MALFVFLAVAIIASNLAGVAPGSTLNRFLEEGRDAAVQVVSLGDR